LFLRLFASLHSKNPYFYGFFNDIPGKRGGILQESPPSVKQRLDEPLKIQ
jgi:hypothetical protein